MMMMVASVMMAITRKGQDNSGGSNDGGSSSDGGSDGDGGNSEGQ
jgi:hypothetical protein